MTGMSFYGYHGVSAAERETGRMFEVDCELEVDLAEAGKSDQLTDTVDYAHVYETIRETVEGKAFSLLERLAGELAARVLDRFGVYSVTLRVRKLNPPVRGGVKHIEVELTRHQADTTKLIDNQS
ncbi:MAG: dihydroneopterin aldolase [candidate division Zixibacteria bacterium]|nr:dihydroneopterin aldolase [candidate division Zixibacteria bacterium]